MKNTSILIALVIAAVTLAGCGNQEASTDAQAPTPVAPGKPSGDAVVVGYDLGSKKKGDMGICVICNKNEGTTAEEEVAATLDYNGKTYLFCNESEKAVFISDPSKFVTQ